LRIDGKTELVGIVGYPIEYTLSPAIHNAAFHVLEMNWLYIPLRVPPGKVESAFRGMKAMGFRGANVTIPHKMESASFVDELKGDASLLGAVNTISFVDGILVGHNTDAEGFADFLKDTGIEVRQASVFIIGAGGASRAVALALVREGASRIFIMNRTPGKAHELRELLKRVNPASEILVRTLDFEGASIARECDLIVNCTPLANEKREELPLNYDSLHSRQWIVDLKYSKPASAFLREADKRGTRTANGEGMLLSQAAASFKVWTGRDAPKKEMREALNSALSHGC
jgi:shikimate dehydrogenase